MSKFKKIFLKSKLKLCLFYSGDGKSQALLVFSLGFACRQKPNVLDRAAGFF
jgi:hypothetical protein